MFGETDILLENAALTPSNDGNSGVQKMNGGAGHGVGYLIRVRDTPKGSNAALTVKFQRRKSGVTAWEDVFAGNATITINAANLKRFQGEGYQSIHALPPNDIPIKDLAALRSLVNKTTAADGEAGFKVGQDGTGSWEHRVTTVASAGSTWSVLIATMAWPGLGINHGLAA